MKEFMQDPQHFKPFYQPLDDKTGSVSADGHTITYHGKLNQTRRICRGDIQRCAAHILSIIIQSSS